MSKIDHSSEAKHDHAGHDHAGHDHSDHGHSHAPDVTARNSKAVAIAACLTGGFMVVEAVGGVLSGSLALLADAAHMVTDTASLALAWWAFQQSRKPANDALTFGRHRLPVLVAFANAVILILLSLWIVIEAVERLVTPTTVLAGPMLIVAFVGLGVNVAAFFILTRGGDNSLNIRSAVLHVLGDLLGSVAAIVAALVIMATGWMPIDPILSVLVSVLILRSAVAVLRQSAHILLEGAPEGVDRDNLAETLVDANDGLTEVHHIHVWSLSEGKAQATLHAVIPDPAQDERVTGNVRRLLRSRFGIEHVTIEVERPGSCADSK